VDHTRADEIATALEEAIAAGIIPAGTVLRQEQLSREYDVSRTPVREALRRLAASGLAEFVPNRGVRVRTLDRNEWSELYRVRSALEGLAAEMAALRITEAQLEDLAVAERRFAAATDALRQELAPAERESHTFEWLQANQSFHDVILEASGSALVARLDRVVRHAFAGRLIWEPGSEIDHRYTQLARQHTAIREALAAGATRGAAELSAEHVIFSWTLFEHILDESAATAARGRRGAARSHDGVG
jgi:DNA-binding GntR family transcriptional regulator